MIIPFALQTYERARASTPPAVLENWIVEVDDSDSVRTGGAQKPPMLLTRPGLRTRLTLPGQVRGLLDPSNPTLDKTYAVAGNSFYEITGNTSTKVGDLAPNSGLVDMAANFDRIVIVSSPDVYCYGATQDSTTPSFRQLAIPQIVEGTDLIPVAVTMLNGYFVIACEDGTYFWLVPGEDEIDTLNFATAEASPDGITGLSTLTNNLVFLGSRTIEIWQPSGDATQPFSRTSGQDYARGCLGRDTVVNADNALIWVGEDGKVYRASNTPQRISTDGIDERIKLRTGEPSAFGFSHDGHEFYVLNLPGQGTFTYDFSTQTWSEFSSTNYVGWRPRVSCFTSTGWLCGGDETGKVWVIGDDATDAGAPIIRRATATVPVKSKPSRVDNLVLDVGASTACVWRVRWAEADEQLADQPWIELAQTRAGGEALTLYRLGAARSPYRTFEVEVRDPVVARLSQARIGEAWR